MVSLSILTIYYTILTSPVFRRQHSLFFFESLNKITDIVIAALQSDVDNLSVSSIKILGRFFHTHFINISRRRFSHGTFKIPAKILRIHL